MITIFLVIILTAPDGSASETRQEAASRAECRTEKALAHAAMIEAPKGYKLVSADCEAVK